MIFPASSELIGTVYERSVFIAMRGPSKIEELRGLRLLLELKTLSKARLRPKVSSCKTRHGGTLAPAGIPASPEQP